MYVLRIITDRFSFLFFPFFLDELIARCNEKKAICLCHGKRTKYGNQPWTMEASSSVLKGDEIIFTL